MPRLYIERLADGYAGPLQRGFEFVGPGARLTRGDRVCIKPNLTYPVFRPGVMTNPEAVEALVVYVKNFTDRITICESDSGGYNPFSMTEVFERTGLAQMARRYGVRIVNMSEQPSRSIVCRAGLRRLRVPLPTLLLDETDVFITMPVPKMHLNTIVSLAIKNQWGVIQDPALRLKLHPYFKHVIHAVHKALPRTLVVVDGKYGLTRSGPLRGDVVPLNWIVVADDVYRCDLLVTDLMGLRARDVPHLRHILARERAQSLAGADLNVSPDSFRSREFYLRREWTDYPGLLAFYSRALAWVGYESPLARPLHRLLYRFRQPFY